MKQKLTFVLALVLALMAGFSALPVKAVTLTAISFTIDCEGVASVGNGMMTFDRDNTGDGVETFALVVIDGEGKVLHGEDGSGPLGGPYDAGGGHFVAYDRAPEYNPISVQIISHAGNGLPEQVTTLAVGECEGLPWVEVPEEPVAPRVPGPGQPHGFEQRTILCDVPVYNAPGGMPVGKNMLKAGQTWYVNPASVDGPDGQPWTEVFVGGWQRPFIPTACVG